MSHKYDGALLSYGAGVNSTAMAIMLVNEGWRGPIVFADTGCEWPETYCFMDYFEEEWLKPRGLEITRLQGLPWQRKNGGSSLIAYCEQAHVIPLAAVRWCTAEWKVMPIKRWAEENVIERQLLGIAADEAHRAQHRVRPLVERHIDRKGCIAMIQAEGLSVPRKSGCYICPFQREAQWHELWKLHPELFERAMRLEENSKRTKQDRFRRGHAALDPSGRQTLRHRKERYEAQLPLFDDAEMDDLLAYRPCVCGL